MDLSDLTTVEICIKSSQCSIDVNIKDKFKAGHINEIVSFRSDVNQFPLTRRKDRA